MELSATRSILARIAAGLGILQGLAWTFMTLFAIVLHYWQPAIETPSTYEETLEYLIYYKFIADDGVSDWSKFFFTPSHFSIVMWIYFVLSVLWGGLSIDHYGAIQFKKKRQATVMRLWAVSTIFMSLLDLIFTVLLAADYVTCESDSTSTITQSEYFCFLSVGIVMTLAARGYTLWALNVIFSIILLKKATNISSGSDGDDSLYGSTIPRAKLVTRSVSQRNG